MSGANGGFGLPLFCLTAWGLAACDGSGGDDVDTNRENPDDGVPFAADAATELDGPRSAPSLSQPEPGAPPGDTGGQPAFVPSSGPVPTAPADPGPLVAPDAGPSRGGARADVDAGSQPTALVDAGSGGSEVPPLPGASEPDGAAPASDAGLPQFEIPEEEEDCSGVQFVDPVKACRDLDGLSLGNPVLVTDDDGEWNPGDVATLQVDILGEERDDGLPYYGPAIVALFDVDSSAFAFVRWRTFQVFGIDAGDSVTYELELRLTDDAPTGATVWLHLEPASSDGNTTACDCPDVDVEGTTLAFEVN